MVVVSPSTLGLGAAAVTAWALQRRRLGTDKRMVVVDAGSGSTRCVCLGTRRCDGAVRVVSLADENLRAGLAEAETLHVPNGGTQR